MKPMKPLTLTILLALTVSASADLKTKLRGNSNKTASMTATKNSSGVSITCTPEGEDEYQYGYLIPCCDCLVAELEYLWGDYRYICEDSGDCDDNTGDDGGSSTGLCGGNEVVSGSSDWVWTPATSNGYSCMSPAVDSSKPKMCDGDPTSIVLEVTSAPECLVAYASDCEFSAYDVTQIDADVDMIDCYGTWAAPLWLTPDYWYDGGSSGEIDMIENCPETEVCANFAGGGNPHCYSEISPDNWHGHMTLWKSSDGDVTVALCDSQGSSCSKFGTTGTYPSWYSSNACTNGQDCMFTMVSDIWIGTSGDDGYAYCSQGTYDANSKCSISVQNIQIETSSSFTGNCASLNA